MTQTRLLLILVFLIIVAASPGLGQEIATIDNQTGLDRDQTVSEYENKGVVKTSVTAPNLTIWVSESASGVGLDNRYTDFATYYIRIDYNEEIPRKIRFFIPSDYLAPITRHDLEAAESDHTADLSVVKDGKYMSVETAFDGRQTAIFEIPREASLTFGYLNKSKSRANKLFGIKVPNILGGGAAWEYANRTRIKQDETLLAIRHNPNEKVTVQYDADKRVGGENWIPVPKCSWANSPDVCRFRKSSVDDKTFVLVYSENPPGIRYKTNPGLLTGVRAAKNDLLSIPGRIMNDLTSPFGVMIKGMA